MFKSNNLLNLGLLTVLVLSGVSIYEAADFDTATRPVLDREIPSRSRSDSAATANLNLRSRLGQAQGFDVIAGKDLFNPDRTEMGLAEEPPPPEEPPPEEATPPEGLALSGTILTKETSYALLRLPSVDDGRGRRYELGDMIENFTITDIRQDRVVLHDAFGREVVIKLYDNKPAKPDQGIGRKGARGRRGAAAAQPQEPPAAEKQIPPRPGIDFKPGQPNQPARRWRPGDGGRAGRDGSPLPFLPAK